MRESGGRQAGMKNEGNFGDICLLTGNLYSLLVDRKAGGKERITARHKSPVEHLFIDMDWVVILPAYILFLFTLVFAV